MPVGGSWRTSCFLSRRKRKSDAGGVEVAGTAVKFGDFIKLLGVKLDPSISMNRYVI